MMVDEEEATKDMATNGFGEEGSGHYKRTCTSLSTIAYLGSPCVRVNI
jgi:hypothetical protein